MKKKVLLPFEDNPYSQMYQGCAFSMGIIQGNAQKDLTPWLSSKYINCWYYENLPNKFSYYFSDHWAVEDQILFHQSMDLSTDMFRALYGNDVLALFRKMLDMGFYPHGEFNEEYIPGKRSYQKYYHYHDYILIGYDDNAKQFVSAGYLMDRKYQRFFIPYENMRQSIETVQTGKFHCDFWKYNPNASFELNEKRLLQELSDYLECRITGKTFSANRACGLDAFVALAEHFVKTATEKQYIDDRYTKGVMEHKFYMKMRINYLLEKGYLKCLEYAEIADRVLKMSEKVHLMAMKYNYTGKFSIVEQICLLLNEMVGVEKDYLSRVLSELGQEVCI